MRKTQAKAKAKEGTSLRYRTHRLRRLASAAVLGVGMTAGVIGVTAGVAGAASTAKISATAATSVVSTGTTQAGANMRVTLAGSTARSTKKLDLTVAAQSGTAVFKSLTATGTGVTVNASAVTSTNHHIWVVTLTTTAATATQSISFTAVKYTTSGAHGSIKVTPSGTATAGPFAGSPVTDANAPTAGPSAGNAISASSAPKIAKTGTAQTAGTLTVTLRGTASTAAATTLLDLTAKPHTGNVYWNSASLSSTGVTAKFTTNAPTPANLTKSMVSIKLGHLNSGTNATVKLTGVKYNTATAIGTVTVTPAWGNSATPASFTATYGTFTPASAVNAVATKPTPATAATQSFHATATPSIKPTGSAQAAGTWTIKFTGAKGHGWTKTTTFSIDVFEHTGTNCTVGNRGYVLFTGTPTAKVSSSKNVSTTPTFAVSTSSGTHCSGISHNQLTVTFTNTGTFTSTTANTNHFTIAVSGVKYNVHKGTSQVYGTVEVSATKTTGGAIAPSTTGARTGPSNADIANIVMSGNTPAVTLAPSSYDAGISPVKVIEQVTGAIPSGDYVCITLHDTTSNTNRFNAANAAKASVTAGNGAVTATVKYFTGATAKTSGPATTAVFKVKSASTATKPSTYTVKGLAVNAANAAGSTVDAVGTFSATSHCGAAGVTGTSAGSAVAYTITAAASKRIAGSTAAGTAAAQLLDIFPATRPTKCPGTAANTTTTANVAKRAVILATETHFPDALSSQYLAGRLHTGTLLTAFSSIPAVTLNTLRLEGISHVYVIGGPLAVSTTVVNQLETTPQYACGGSSVRKSSTGATRYLTVTRISGPTQYDTAQAVATYLAKSFVGTGKFPVAYGGVNKTGGNGAYNDTSGKASPAGIGTTMKTAIVADGKVFQDAMSAGPIAYNKGYPVLLTTPSKLSPQAAGALTALTIQQVIVMGGPDAVSNTVVTSLQAMGLSVLRIAGVDYTDTAVQAAKFEIAPTATGAGLGWKPSSHQHTAAVARGNGFSDGLAGAVVTGSNSWPLLLTENPTTVGSYLTAFLKSAGTGGPGVDQTTTNPTYRITTVVIFGGTLAITPTVVKTIRTDLHTG